MLTISRELIVTSIVIYLLRNLLVNKDKINRNISFIMILIALILDILSSMILLMILWGGKVYEYNLYWYG